MGFYKESRRAESFEAAIETALSAVLVSPQFLFRVEQDPVGVCTEHGLSHQRSGTGIPPIVLSVEQYSGRRAAENCRAQAS